MIKRWILACVLGLFASSLVMAGEPTSPEDNNPLTNEDANACYTGGTWEGKCGSSDVNGDWIIEQWENDYMFDAGWYLIRFEAGLISRADFPSEYRWALPPEPEPTAGPPAPPAPSTPPPPPTCYDSALPGYVDVQYTGTPNVDTNLPRFGSTDGTCTTPIGASTSAYIVDDPAECTLRYVDTMQAFGYTTGPAGLYICISAI